MDMVVQVTATGPGLITWHHKFFKLKISLTMFARSCLVLRAARLHALQPQRAPRMRPSLSTTAILRATPSLPLDQAADDLEGEMEDVEEDDMDEYDEEPEDNMEAEFEEDEEFDEEDRGAGTFDVDSNAAQDGRKTTFRTFLEENAKYKHATRPQWLAGHGVRRSLI